MGPLIPPFRYMPVEDGVYRSAYPTEKNFRFLRRLHLKTILSLTPKPPTEELQAFCAAEGIVIIHEKVAKFKDQITFSHAKAVELLQVVLQPAKHPILVHCLDGANVTGALLMCLRKLQMWGLPCIIGEFTRFTRDGAIDPAESEFVEQFRHEIILPSELPEWLWQGQRIAKHPLLGIRYAAPPQQLQAQATATVDPDLLRKSEISEADMGVLSRNLRALALEGLPDTRK